jgi:hypothetical protein
MTEIYDSTKDTQEHIYKVYTYMCKAADDLIIRGSIHDASKLESPEKEYFDKYTPRLATLKFGTEEYTQNIQDLKPALEHHYANNSHHPQYYEGGINDMNLFDLVEMFFDWKASTERGVGGDILKSIDINAERFGISKQLRKILINTEHYIKQKQLK